MSPEKRGIFVEMISQRLASVLSLPFPLQDGVVSLTDAQHELLKGTDKTGNTQLMTATEHGERGSIEFLIRHGADVNYRNKKTQQRAIDIAWEQGDYECMLVLLEADSDFPETFDLTALLGDEVAPEDLKLFVKEINKLHEWIREGNVKEVQHVVSKQKNLRYINSAGQSALETAARYGNVNILASLLGIPLPVPTGKIDIPENKARFLTVTDTLGDTPLLSAAREGKEINVELLLRSGADVNFRNLSGKAAVDLAWENFHYKVVLILLEADSDFPHEFSLENLMDGDGKDELKEFVDSRTGFHNMIRLGSLEEVKNFIKENDKPSRIYLNIQGQSALYTAINEKKYDTYAFLKSVGVYFKDEQEEISLDALKMEDRVELKSYLIQYFPKIPDSHILFLVSKSKSSRSHNDFRGTVYNIYKNLDEIPLVSKILQVVQYADYIEIIFDFDRVDVSHMEPRHSSSTRGATDYKSGRLYVGFKMDTPEQEHECLGTLAHELTHLAMQISFQNDCNPYGRTDALQKSLFVNEIVSGTREECINSEDVNYVIKRVFTDYIDPGDWPAELIARVPQILAQYGEDEGVDIINTHTPQLLSYFTDSILPKCDAFIQQNFLIKPRNMIRMLNQYLGHLNELEKVNISFKDISYVTEFFDNTGKNVLLVNTSNTWLSCINIHQALQKNLDYSLTHSYLILQLNDFEYFEEDLIDAFSSDVSNVMVIECQNTITQKLLSRVLKNVARVFRHSKYKKLVLIVHNDNVAEVKTLLGKERLSSKMLEQTNKEFSLTDFSEESQKKILESTVMFQGTNTLLKNIVHEGLTNTVDSETLVRLISNNEIVIGNKLNDLGELRYYYIDRSFNIHTEISEEILKDESLSDLFFIGGSNINLVNRYHNVEICNEDNREIEEEMFCNLCENYSNRNIHYLRFINKQLIWIKTKGSISSLRSYIITESRINYAESDIIERTLDQFPIIISDTAGMGKTTVVTNLALEMKRKFPFSWVFRIDLNSYNHELETELNKKEKSLRGVDLDLGLNFLLDKMLKVQTQFEKNLIKESFKKGSNVIMIFDGFDEISPLYEKVVLNLIQSLKNSTVKKMFITCRPYVAELLEEKFSVISFGIEPFSHDTKKQFLLKFWTKRFDLNKSEHRNSDEETKLESFAESLLEKLSVSINDRQQSFTGIPLQLRMIAEIFPEGIEIERTGRLSLHGHDITLPETLNLVGLYERFIDKKYDVYKIEKMKPTTAIAAADVEEGRQTFIKNHQKIAVYTLLPNEQNSFLLSEEDVEDLELFLDRIIEGKEKTGIIDGVIKIINIRRPHFIHLTFAEYFTASFFILKLSRKNQSTEVRKLILTNIFVSQTFKVVRHFLNEYMENFAIAEVVLDAYGTSIHDLWLSNPGSLCNRHDKTALHIAVVENNEHIVKFFLLSLNKQSEILQKLLNSEDMNGQPALHAAAENGHFKIMQWLVEQGADINVKDNDGKTVLYHAAKEDIQVLEYLIRHGAKTKLVDMTQLYMHMENKSEMKTFKWLMEHGGDINVGDLHGDTLIYHAAMKGDLETVKWLIDKGEVDIVGNDEDDRSLLHYCAGSRKWEIVKWLLAHDKFDVNLKDKDGYTILHYAAYNGYKDIVQWLIRSKDLGGGGANINIVDNTGRNVLHDAASSGNLELMKWLVSLPDKGERGVDINFPDFDGDTVLHEAALFGQSQMLQWLAMPKENGGGGADIMATSKSGQTALDMAALLGNLEIVQFLMSKISDKYVVEKLCKKILHKAASFGELRLLEWLLQSATADINYRDESGRCLLHYAAEHNNFAVVKWLLESGAGVDFVDGDGKTALHEAAGTGVRDIEEWLEERGIFIRSVDGNITGVKKINIELEPNQYHFIQYLKDKDYQVKEMGFGKFVFNVQALATLKLLLERGANINAVDKHRRTPLYYATFLKKTGVVGCDVLKLLIAPSEHSERRADVGICDDTGKTLMHKLAEDDDFFLMKWLLETNADSRKLVNAVDSNGSTPLHYAAKSVMQDSVVVLVIYGADLNTVNKYKRTALHEAADTDYIETLKYLAGHMIHRGSHTALDAVDIDGCTALHYASQRGNIQAVKFLSQKGVDINIQDNGGRTPLHLAAAHGRTKVVKYLVERNVLDLQDNNGKTAMDLAHAERYEDVITFLKHGNFATGDSESTSTSIANLAELQQHLKAVELQPTETSGISGCSSQLRMKRDLDNCYNKEHDYFPYNPQKDLKSVDHGRYSKLYSSICMVTVFKNAGEFSQSDTSRGVYNIFAYNKYIGDIISKEVNNLSSRETGILTDHLTRAFNFFKLYPVEHLLTELLKDTNGLDNHESWIFDNGEYTLTILNHGEYYEMFSQDFNYENMFRMKKYLTFKQLQNFVKSFFKWRSGKTMYKVLTLTPNLPPHLIDEIKLAAFWNNEGIIPDDVMFINEHRLLIENIPAELVQQIFLVKRKRPEVALLRSDFFKNNEDISVQLEKLPSLIASLTIEQNEAITSVIKRFNIPFDCLHIDDLHDDEKKMLVRYKKKLSSKLKEVRFISTEILSATSWETLADELREQPSITKDFTTDVIKTTKDLHKTASDTATIKGMATQTIFFLPDIIRFTNYGDSKNLVQTSTILGGDLAINTIYEQSVNQLIKTIPVGRAKLLSKLPITSPIFKALSIYSIVQLHKELQKSPENSEERSIIKHKLGEQYVTAGLIVAEMLGIEVTPLWIALVAEQLIFDATSFRKTHHLDIPFWEAFVMSLGFKQDKLQNIFEERQLVEINLAAANRRNDESRVTYGWAIIKLPKLDKMKWQNIEKDTVPRDIRDVERNAKEELSSITSPQQITTIDGFRLVKTYKLRSKLVYGNTVVSKGRMISSVWQKAVYNIQREEVETSFSCLLSHDKNFPERSNYFMLQGSGNNTNWQHISSVYRKSKHVKKVAAPQDVRSIVNELNQLEINCSSLAALYSNCKTYADYNAQKNVYLAYDPRDGNLTINATVFGLHQLDLCSTENMITNNFTLPNISSRQSPYVLTVEVGSKAYPSSVNFTNQTGAFFLNDYTKKIVSQYVITDSIIDYVIKDTTFATRIYFAQSSLHNEKTATCNTVNGDFRSIAVKSWTCNRRTDNVSYIENLHLEHSASINLSGDKTYLQFYLGNYFVDEYLELSATHVDIIDARGKLANLSKIKMSTQVRSFDVGIRSNIVIRDGVSEFRVTGEFLTELTHVHYKKSGHNESVLFYEITVEDLWEVIKTMSRNNMTDNDRIPFDIRFSCNQVQLQWLNEVPTISILHITGTFDGIIAVLQMQQKSDRILISKDNYLLELEIHYSKLAILDNTLILQSVLKPNELDVNIDTHNKFFERENYAGDLIKLYSYVFSDDGNILIFKSSDGHPVYHVIQADSRIQVNNIKYTIGNGILCAQSSGRSVIDGRQLINSPSSRILGSTGEIIEICTEESLTNSDMFLRNCSLVINDVELKNMKDNTKINFKGFQTYSVRTLKDTLKYKDGAENADSSQYFKNSSILNVEDQRTEIPLHGANARSEPHVRLREVAVSSVDVTQTKKPVPDGLPFSDMPVRRHDPKRLARSLRTSHDMSSGADRTVSSLLVDLVGWLRNTYNWMSSSAVLKTNEEFLGNDRELLHTAEQPANFFNCQWFHLNGTLSLLDLAVRKFTKTKPLPLKETPLNRLWLQGEVLRIVAGFEDILDKIAEGKRREKLVFDPVDLQNILLKEVSRGNYKNVGKILYDSLDNKNIAEAGDEDIAVVVRMGERNGSIRRKLADKRQSPLRFPHGKIRVTLAGSRIQFNLIEISFISAGLFNSYPSGCSTEVGLPPTTDSTVILQAATLTSPTPDSAVILQAATLSYSFSHPRLSSHPPGCSTGIGLSPPPTQQSSTRLHHRCMDSHTPDSAVILQATALRYGFPYAPHSCHSLRCSTDVRLTSTPDSAIIMQAAALGYGFPTPDSAVILQAAALRYGFPLTRLSNHPPGYSTDKQLPSTPDSSVILQAAALASHTPDSAVILQTAALRYGFPYLRLSTVILQAAALIRVFGYPRLSSLHPCCSTDVRLRLPLDPGICQLPPSAPSLTPIPPNTIRVILLLPELPTCRAWNCVQTEDKLLVM
ncbi:hypothetical protein PR048_028105 [Dryococelus australis]|uniref:NACHT domain-containing protein n=1 Tax=Dryococelus australis TaxID=614101 RepID=A0ABQ9GIB7_9NEOP|nr:hypothetical protein PR048_028105 [Dryococelus australis]